MTLFIPYIGRKVIKIFPEYVDKYPINCLVSTISIHGRN